MSEYLVVIEHDGDSWGAYCPDLPGVGVVGETREEVEQLIREAISLHLEGLREAGEPIPGARGRRYDAGRRACRVGSASIPELRLCSSSFGWGHLGTSSDIFRTSQRQHISA